MTAPLSKNRYTLFLQKGGPSTQLSPLYSLNDYTIGSMSFSASKNTRVAGTNPDGSFALLYDQREPPEALGDITINTYRVPNVDFLEEAVRDNKSVVLQQRYLPCGLLTDPFNDWSDLVHVLADVTGVEFDETRNIQPSGENSTATYTLTPKYNVHLVMPEVLKLQTGTETHVRAIDTIPAKGRAIGTIPFAGLSDGSVIFSSDYGSTFETITNLPFAPGNDAVNELVASVSCDVNFRLIAGSGISPSIAFGDASYGDEINLAWTESAGLGAASGTVGSLLINSYGVIYAAIGTDIYKSDDRGATFTLVYDGSDTITYMVEAPDYTVWACGENGLLLKQVEANGTFYLAVSPSGNHNTVIDVANDMTVICGSGTKLFRSNNEAQNAGGWSQLSLDFGSPVIYCKFIGSRDSAGGDSELLQIVCENGKVYFSESGGAHFRQITSPTTTITSGCYVNQHLHLVVGNTGTILRIGTPV